MKRKIIKIDEDKCTGCGLCAEACHEGAIGMVNSKAKLLRDDYCDGLGDCLPACPAGAISFEEREAAAYDKAAVMEKYLNDDKALSCGCPGIETKSIKGKAGCHNISGENKSRLSQWPIQMKLVPESAPYFDGADLLVAADCTAYAFGDFHERFISGRVTLIGCPKLDNADYSEMLMEILKNNSIKSLTVVRMEVPCCGGLEYAVKKALRDSEKEIPIQVVTISADGKVLN